MRAIVAVVIAALLAALVTLWFQGLEGYIIAVVPPYRAQISLQLLVVLAIVLVVVGYGLMRLLIRLFTTPSAVRQWRQRRRMQQAIAALQEAVAGWQLGKPKEGFRALDRCHRLGYGSAAAAVLACEAALAVGNEAQAENALARIPEAHPWGSVKRLLEARFGLTFQRHDRLEQALAALATDRQIAPSVRERLLLQAAQHNGDWQQAFEVARALYRHKLLSPAQWRAVVEQAIPELVRAARASGEKITDWWQQKLTREERSDPLVVAAGVRALIAAGCSDEAVALAEPLLQQRYAPELLAALMPALPVNNHWLERLEKWSTQQQDPLLLEALLRIALGLRLFGKAKSYFAQLYQRDPERARQVAAEKLLSHGALALLWDEAEQSSSTDLRAEAPERAATAELPVPVAPSVVAEPNPDNETRTR